MCKFGGLKGQRDRGERETEKQREISVVKCTVCHLEKRRNKNLQRDHLFIICAYMI